MKRSIETIFCCACWALRDSSSLSITGSKYSSFSATGGDRRMTAAWGPTRAQRRPLTTAVMTATEPNHTRSTWVRSVASTVAALSVLVCASVTTPLDATAASASPQQPVVEALVQLADEEVDWTKLLPDPGQAPGASMIITASKERGGKPSLGASVAMDRLKFPVMMQLFPRNAVGGASWPGDFEEKGTYSVEVAVCGGAGGARGGVCETPLPVVGSGESIFVTGLEDVPEVAESGGMRVPATVILTAPSARILTPSS